MNLMLPGVQVVKTAVALVKEESLIFKHTSRCGPSRPPPRLVPLAIYAMSATSLIHVLWIF